MTDETPDSPTWPLRPWLLAGLLGLSGFLIWAVAGGDGPGTRIGWQAAVTALLFFGSAAFALTLERDRWKEPLGFAVIVGLVMAGLAWRAVGAGEALATPEYGFMAGVIATGLSLPLFRAGFQRRRWATPYPAVYRAVWGDAICVAGSVAFLGASWLLLFVLSELFELLKIAVLKDLMRADWFEWTFSGAALGAALGTLRNEFGIVGTLQRVVTTVLSILAVPLAAGLALFVVAMVVSGPDVLWAATRSATPILLLCAAGAWALTNAILRESDGAMSVNRALRGAAMVLALSVMPLTVFAAISLGTRVAQRGLSPERLWGLIAIAAATAYGLAWLVAVLRGLRRNWRDNVRRANLHLAIAIIVIALVLALPILDFGAISARQQIARVQSGAVSAEDFDYAALRWDFGDAGRRALATLGHSANRAIAEKAMTALRQHERPSSSFDRSSGAANLRMQPVDAQLEARLREYIEKQPFACDVACVALDLGATGDGRNRVAIVHGTGYDIVMVGPGGAVAAPPPAPAPSVSAGSKVEVRTIPRRTILVDGKPVGPPLD